MSDKARSNGTPHWILENIYPAIESEEFKKAFARLEIDIGALIGFMDENNISEQKQDRENPEGLVTTLRTLMEKINEIWRLQATLNAYLNGFISTDSYNTEATKKYSELEFLTVRFHEIGIRFKGWMGRVFEDVDELNKIVSKDSYLEAERYYLQKTLEQAKFQMSHAEETLASELALSSTNGWEKLQGTITSQLVVPFEIDGEISEIPMAALQNLRRSHPDESVRERAFRAEIEALESVRESLAACMNGIKGSVNTLNRRRGREDSLHSALDRGRIYRKTLSAMLAAMEESFPMFRSYFKSKAEKLGKEKLAWWDLFVAMGEVDRIFTFKEAVDFISTQLQAFSPQLAEFTLRVHEEGWIDAEPRKGKRAGAFCMEIPLREESRILMNFDGSLDQLFTLTHELGHAFHNECQVGLTMAQRETPMTLAETASIFNETLITDAALEAAETPAERLTILESFLVNASQVIVDIYSRYLFEKEVFERRESVELSADDFCEIMLRAQAETYGEALDPMQRHAYMWAWKPHYYSAEQSFYNFPYAFGLLFGLGLYAIYQERGDGFVTDYKDLLRSTGQDTAEALSTKFGLDISTIDFWRKSLRIIERRIEEYQSL